LALPLDEPLFTVRPSFVKILDRDLAAAGAVAKRLAERTKATVLDSG
jgi:hypothetical protein